MIENSFLSMICANPYSYHSTIRLIIKLQVINLEVVSKLMKL